MRNLVTIEAQLNDVFVLPQVRAGFDVACLPDSPPCSSGLAVDLNSRRQQIPKTKRVHKSSPLFSSPTSFACSVEVDIHQLPHDSRTIALSSPENIAERLIAAGIDRDREELVHSLSCSSRQEEEQEDDSDSVEVAELDTTSSEGF